MASSTSSSDPRGAEPQREALVEHAFLRDVPRGAWSRAAAIAFGLTILGTFAWELEARSLGLRAGDLGESVSHWAVERRKVDAGPRDQIVLVGDSRILFGTDLDVWQELTGRRPIQLALRGTPAPPFLSDIANDEHFAGVVVLGMSEVLYFSGRPGLRGNALEYTRTESPSQRMGHALHLELSRGLAFLDQDYALFPLVEQLDVPNRGGVKGPYLVVWKLLETSDDRQSHMWPRIETDAYLRAHAILAWGDAVGPPLGADQITKTIDAAKRDCARIRSRGGDVVFLRPPSGQPNRGNEELRAPRAKVWDALLRETGSQGIHFEDYAAMQGLEIPEHSHLTRASATLFTRAYVGELVRLLPRLVRAPTPSERGP